MAGATRHCGRQTGRRRSDPDVRTAKSFLLGFQRPLTIALFAVPVITFWHRHQHARRTTRNIGQRRVTHAFRPHSCVFRPLARARAQHLPHFRQ